MELEEVHAAILSGYTLDSLKRMLSFELNRELSDITNSTKGMKAIAFSVVATANREAWLGDLIDAMQRSNPDNESVSNLRYQDVGNQQYDDRFSRIEHDLHDLKAALFGIEGMSKSGLVYTITELHRQTEQLEATVRGARTFNIVVSASVLINVAINALMYLR